MFKFFITIYSSGSLTHGFPEQLFLTATKECKVVGSMVIPLCCSYKAICIFFFSTTIVTFYFQLSFTTIVIKNNSLLNCLPFIFTSPQFVVFEHIFNHIHTTKENINDRNKGQMNITGRHLVQLIPMTNSSKVQCCNQEVDYGHRWQTSRCDLF